MAIVIFWISCAFAGAALLSAHDKAGLGCAAGGCLGPIGVLLAWIERINLDRKADLQREEIRSAELRELAAARPPVPLLPPREVREVRDERDCPHCAEKILVQAKVCKHCGRDVEPAAT